MRLPYHIARSSASGAKSGMRTRARRIFYKHRAAAAQQTYAPSHTCNFVTVANLPLASVTYGKPRAARITSISGVTNAYHA